MSRKPLGEMTFSSIYPLYQQKLARKGHSNAELNQVITWLTGYDDAAINQHLQGAATFADFFAGAPAFNPNAKLITGMICGVRVEDIAEPLTQKVRYLDKLVDEVARGKQMTKILRH